MKNKLLKLIIFIFIIASAVVIANIGAWITYPKHFLKPQLIFIAYKQLLPKNLLPKIIINTSIASLIYSMVMLKLFVIKPTSNSKYGYAVFAKFNELKKMGFNFQKGILLGKLKGKFIRTDKPYSTLVLAPPGTGKTSGVVIPTLLICKHSMIIHDPKGELYDITAKVRQDKLKQKVLLFDPVNKETCHFNPFAKSMLPKDKDDIKAYVSTIAGIIFSSPDKSIKDDYFLDTARSAFVFFTEWLIWKNKESSIPQIRGKLLEEMNIADNIEFMLNIDNLPTYIKKDGRGVLIASGSDNQWAGVMGELGTFLEPFGESNIAKSLSGDCDFNSDTFRKGNASLYIKVRDKDRKKLKPIISMVIELLGSQLISEPPKEDDNQVSFILDEFTRLAKMEIIADLPSISRSYKISTLFVAQDYEQISTVYGKDYISIFDSNCAYKVIFKQNNYFTAERLSKLIGNKTVERVSNSKGKSMKGSTITAGNSSNKSESTSQEGLALVTPQDILNLEDGKCLIITQGFASKPVLADIIKWWREKIV